MKWSMALGPMRDIESSFGNVVLEHCLNIVKICMSEKVLWKYMLYCLNNENYC